jgi:hypothetical protein
MVSTSSARNRRFENLVGKSVANSSLLPNKLLSPTSELGIVTAIENGETSTYLGNCANDRTLDAVHCLLAIYDELGKDEPDEEFISETVTRFKEYL